MEKEPGKLKSTYNKYIRISLTTARDVVCNKCWMGVCICMQYYDYIINNLRFFNQICQLVQHLHIAQLCITPCRSTVIIPCVWRFHIYQKSHQESSSSDVSSSVKSATGNLSSAAIPVSCASSIRNRLHWQWDSKFHFLRCFSLVWKLEDKYTGMHYYCKMICVVYCKVAARCQ